MFQEQIERITNGVEVPPQRHFIHIRTGLREMMRHHAGVVEHFQTRPADRQTMIRFDAVAAAVRLRKKRLVVQSRTANGFACEYVCKPVDMLYFDRRTAVVVVVPYNSAAV